MTSLTVDSLTSTTQLLLSPTSLNELKVKAINQISIDLISINTPLDSPSINLITSTLKLALKSTNYLLSTTTLASLPSFFAHLSPTTTSSPTALKLALLNLLPSSHLADSKDSTRQLATAAFIQAAKSCLLFDHSSTTTATTAPPKESPWAYLSRTLIDSAFHSKSPKAREQALIYLIAIRDPAFSLPLPPLRPFLLPLIALLADSDQAVRALALKSTILLFSDRVNVSDHARTDLKKLLTEKGKEGAVNKKVVESVLEAVLGSPHDPLPSPQTPTLRDSSPPPTSSQLRPLSLPLSVSVSLSTQRSVSSPVTTSTSASAIPPPPPSQSTEIPPIYISSLSDLQAEFEKMKPSFEGKETEFNWIERDKNILRIRGIIKSGFFMGPGKEEERDAFLTGFKGVLEGVLKTASSLRTTVAVSALTLISELSVSLTSHLDPLLDPLLSHCLSMAGQTKKLVAVASQSTATTLIQNSNYHLKTLQLLLTSMSDKIALARTFISAHVLTFIQTHSVKSKSLFETTGGLTVIEAILKKGLGDSNLVVKENCRKSFWLVREVWKDVGERVMQGLDIPSRKQLEKADPALLPGGGKKVLGSAPSIEGGLQTKRIGVRQQFIKARTVNKVEVDENKREEQAEDGQRRIPSVVSPPTTPLPLPAPSSSTQKTFLPSSPTRLPVSSSKLVHPASPTLSSTQNSPLRSVSSPTRLPTTSNTPLKKPQPSTPLRSSTPPLPLANTNSSLMDLSLPFKLDDHDSSLDFEAGGAGAGGGGSKGGESSSSFGSPSNSFRTLPGGGGGSSSGGARRDASLILPIPDPIVDDALRGQAAQAEQAAQRLLELADEDEDEGEERVEKLMEGLNLNVVNQQDLMSTPVKPIGVKRDVFEDSPMAGGSDGRGGLTPIGGKNNWWMRKSSLGTTTTASSLSIRNGNGNGTGTTLAKERSEEEISNLVSELNGGTISESGLKELCGLSRERPVREDDDDEEGKEAETFWQNGKLFLKVWNGLVEFLKAGDKTRDRRDSSLVLLKELIENQCPCFAGEELEVYSLLFHLREDPSRTTIAAIDAVGEIFCNQLEPLYGLGLLRTSLESHLSLSSSPTAGRVVEPTKAKSFALGLKLLGKFLERLPGEVLEEELPKAKDLIKLGLNDSKSGDLRRAAVMALVDAQKSLQDEERLYVMVGGLGKDQMNLLSYYIERGKPRQ